VVFGNWKVVFGNWKVVFGNSKVVFGNWYSETRNHVFGDCELHSETVIWKLEPWNWETFKIHHRTLM